MCVLACTLTHVCGHGTAALCSWVGEPAAPQPRGLGPACPWFVAGEEPGAGAGPGAHTPGLTRPPRRGGEGGRPPPVHLSGWSSSQSCFLLAEREGLDSPPRRRVRLPPALNLRLVWLSRAPAVTAGDAHRVCCGLCSQGLPGCGVPQPLSTASDVSTALLCVQRQFGVRPDVLSEVSIPGGRLSAAVQALYHPPAGARGHAQGPGDGLCRLRVQKDGLGTLRRETGGTFIMGGFISDLES